MLRDKPLCVNFKVDDIINQLVDNCKTKAIKDDWLDRQKKNQARLKERQVGELDIDSMVDVRDTNYVWCEGRVTLIIEQMNKDTLYVVHFEGKSSSEDEVIYKTSERLAKHRTFTSRLEIPRYEVTKNKDGVNVYVLRNQMLNIYNLLLAQ